MIRTQSLENFQRWSRLSAMPNVIYIHGANADSDNFNYFKLKLPEHDSIAPNYDMSEDPFDLVMGFKRQKEKAFGNEPVVIVGHSFGGILASWYASVNPGIVSHLVTIATPWEGTPVARIFGYFWRNADVFKNTMPGATVLAMLQEKKFEGPHTNIICTRGANPVAGIGGKANDGMISCDSQGKTPPGFKNTQTHHIEAGHSGVLLNNNVTGLLQAIITGETDERLVDTE